MKKSTTLTPDLEVPKGYRAYKLKGIDHTIIAKKGGPSAQQIKTAGSYAELRNNQKEFAVASMLSKVLRESLSEGMSEICETYVSARLTAQFRNLAKYEDGPTGMRPVFVSKHGHHLNGFEFNTTAPYEEIFGAKYFIRNGSKKGQVILHFPAFTPDKTFVKPLGATNFKITARLVALSDYSFDRVENEYRALNGDLNGKFGSFESAMLPILKIPTEPLTTMISIDHKQIPYEAGLFLVMAISFFRYEGGKFIHLAKESGMTIKQVFNTL